MSLTDRIKEVRKENKLTQKEFGERLLVSASYISKVESGKESPSRSFIRLLSHEFNVDEDWLSLGIGEKEYVREEYDRKDSDEDMIMGLALILDLIKTKSNTLYAHFSMILSFVANIMLGYTMNETDKAMYLEKVQYLMADLDRCLHIANDLSSRGGFDEENIEETTAILQKHQTVVADDVADIINSIRIAHIPYTKENLDKFKNIQPKTEA